MRSLSVQIQPERSPGLDIAAVAGAFAAIANDTRLLLFHFDSTVKVDSAAALDD